MTRDSDTYISLSTRVRIANRYPNAIFICIHFNSGQPKAHGIETFTISPVGVPHLGRGHRARDEHMVPGNIMGSASVALATAAQSRALMYLRRYNIADRGIKHARFNVLTGIKIPAILIEGGFLSNRTEATKIHSRTYQQTLASALARAVYIYGSAINKRTAQSYSRSGHPTYRTHRPSSIRASSSHLGRSQ
jgi:N-acetylmuramoyl-L-alanine amidase